MQYYPIAKIHAQRIVNFGQFSPNMHNACAYNCPHAQLFTFIVYIVQNIHSVCASKTFEITNCDIKNPLRSQFATTEILYTTN